MWYNIRRKERETPGKDTERAVYDFSSSPLLDRRSPGERRTRVGTDLLILFGITLFATLIVGYIPGTVAVMIFGFNAFSAMLGDPAARSAGFVFDSEEFAELIGTISESEGYRIAEAFGGAWTTALALFVLLAVQRRSLATAGIERRGAVKRCALGFLLGAALCSATVFVSCLSHASTFEGFSGGGAPLYVILTLFGYFIQATAEELLIHGFFLTSNVRRFGWLQSVLLSALLFTFLMHPPYATTKGVTLLSLLNVFLFAVFLGLFVIRTGSVFGAAAFHAAWSFTEGQIFGCPVKGIPSLSPFGLFTVTSDAGRGVTNGGAFGPEGGLAATMILMLALTAVLFFPSFKKKDETPR